MARASVKKRLSSMILLVCPVVTLIMSPTTNYDPINPIKVLAATSIGYCCLALIIKNWKSFRFDASKMLLLGIFLFLLGLVLSILFSGAPWSQQFWGSFGRNNGLINYLALCAILVCSSLLVNKDFYRKIILSLTWTSVPMTIYCLVQLWGMDPFPWSSFQAFGTLGNVNFLSAFLGMASIGNFSLMVAGQLKLPTRIALALLVGIDLFIIAETDSIQGLIIFGLGFVIVVGFRIKEKSKGLFFSYLLSSIALFGLALAAVFERGPLAKFIFQPTIIFRAEYMSAGLRMFKEHFFFGVGIDSYGDWYSYSRGVIATFRTGINRTSNSAHNVFIDIAAGSGIIAITGFLIINLVVLIYAIRYFKSKPSPDPIFVSLFAIWIAYTVQSSISINQIGIAVWGWAIAGSVIGYAKSHEFPIEAKADKVKRNTKNTLGAADSLVAFFGLAIGFTIAFLPLKVDADYRKFANAGDLLKMMETVKRTPSSSVLVGQAQIAATRSSYFAQARDLNDFLISKYPRDFFGWQSRAVLDQVEPQEQSRARSKIKELDPFFFCYDVNPTEEIRSTLASLPRPEQWELARFWGFEVDAVRPQDFTFGLLDREKYELRLTQYCNLNG